MNNNGSLGIVKSPNSVDYLYRISLKALIRNDQGEILVVKEAGRDWWDLPGGGLDYGEPIKKGLARELKEEVDLEGDFTYRIIVAEEPKHLERLDVMQIRLVFQVTPEKIQFNTGVDGDEVAFMSLEELRRSSPPKSYLVTHLDNILNS